MPLRGFHVNFGNHGFWLPNDPRGSNSDFVRAPHLVPFGKATKVENRENVARKDHDRRLREEAKRAMFYPAVELTGEQALSVGTGFANCARKSGYVIYACTILPRHVHLVIRPHRYRIEQVVNLLKGAATRQLLHDGLHPLMEYRDRRGRVPSPFQEECGHEFLYTVDDMWRAIKYVRGNPLKEKKPVQHWSFVTPYDGSLTGSMVHAARRARRGTGVVPRLMLLPLLWASRIRGRRRWCCR